MSKRHGRIILNPLFTIAIMANKNTCDLVKQAPDYVSPLPFSHSKLAESIELHVLPIRS